jgi:hypothetical protein
MALILKSQPPGCFQRVTRVSGVAGCERGVVFLMTRGI